MFEVNFESFFDRPKIVSKFKDAALRTLSKFGAYVRTRAARSIRSRKKGHAAPGNPPLSHVGLLKKMIFFQYEPDDFGVVIGPAFLNGGKRGGTKPVTELLEFGGTTTQWRTKKAAVYHKFPYMKPAFDAEVGKFAGMFRDSIK